MYHVCKLSINLIGVYGQDYTVTVLRRSRTANAFILGSTYDYPISSNFTLECLVLSNKVSVTKPTNFRWNNTGCFTTRRHTAPTCFPTNQTTKSVTGKNLVAEDAGNISCTVSIGGVDYTSGPFTLRISGIHNVFGIIETCLIVM